MSRMNNNRVLRETAMVARDRNMTYGEYQVYLYSQIPNTVPSAKEVIRLENKRNQAKKELLKFEPSDEQYHALNDEIDSLSQQIFSCKKYMGIL